MITFRKRLLSFLCALCILLSTCADALSYAAAAYTVDFSREEYTYSLPGGEKIFLSALLENLSINADLTGSTAQFSDDMPEGLVELSPVTDSGIVTDWTMTSLAPFSTKHALTVKLADGTRYVIGVTDDVTLPVSGIWENGSDGSGAWGIDADGALTISGTGRMKDYAGVTDADAPWRDYELRKKITSVKIENGITHLGKNILTRAYMASIDASNCVTLADTGSDLFKAGAYGTEGSSASYLKSVDFSGCTIFTGFGGNAFASCSSIETINISGTRMAGISIFDSSKTALITLICRNCTQITNLNLTGWTKLEYLDLTGCTGLKEKDALTLTNVDSLTELYLPNEIKPSVLKNLPDRENLTIHFDGSLDDWLSNGFSYENGKYGNRNVVFSVNPAWKITDESGNMLYYKDGTAYRAAQFNTLSACYNAFGSLYSDRTGNTQYNDAVVWELTRGEYAMTAEDAALPRDNTTPVTITGGEDAEPGVIQYGDLAQDSWMFQVNGGSLTFQNLTVDAEGKGGAARLETGSLKLDGASFVNGSGAGGAVYLNGGSFQMDNAEITGCTSTDGGAVYVAAHGENSAKLLFSGASRVAGNKSGENDCNVDLSAFNETSDETSYPSGLIQTDGLRRGAEIGLTFSQNSPRSKLGEAFGETTSAEASNSVLTAFVNDRIRDGSGEKLRGWPAVYGTAGEIQWASAIRAAIKHLVGGTVNEVPDSQDLIVPGMNADAIPVNPPASGFRALYAQMNTAVAAFEAGGSGCAYYRTQIGDAVVSSLRFDTERMRWQYAPENTEGTGDSQELVDIQPGDTVTLYYYTDPLPMKIRFVQREESGSLSPLDETRYPEQTFSLGRGAWLGSGDIAPLALQDESELPTVIQNYYYWYMGLGPEGIEAESDLLCTELTRYELQNTPTGVLCRSGEEDDGVVYPANTIYILYSTEAPRGSTELSLFNQSKYPLTIRQIFAGVTEDTPDSITAWTACTAVYADSTGMLHLMGESGLSVSNDSTLPAAKLVLLDAANRQFRLSGGFSDTPENFEAFVSLSNAEEKIDLTGGAVSDFGDAVTGALSGWKEGVAAVFTGQVTRDVTITKEWRDRTAEAGADWSNGESSIVLQFFDSKGESVLIKQAANEGEAYAGVLVDEANHQVTLSRVNGAWPEKWTVAMPDTITTVREAEIYGYYDTIVTDFAENTISILNTRAICKVDHDGEETGFDSLAGAIQYITDHYLYDAVIEMLTDYTMPSSDTLKVPDGFTITLTTASADGTHYGYTGGTDSVDSSDSADRSGSTDSSDGADGAGSESAKRAVITRDDGFTAGSMLVNDTASSQLIVTNLILDGGRVPATGSTISNRGTLLISGSELKNSLSSSSGGAVSSTGGSVTLTDSGFSGNQAVNGGAVFAAAGNMTIADCVFSGNRAEDGGDDGDSGGTGGALCYRGEGTVTLSGETRFQNNAARQGGAVFAAAGSVRLTDSTAFEGNTAEEDGGAVYSGNAAVDTEENVRFQNNTAGSCGGAVFADRGTIVVTGSELRSNSAANGAAVYVKTGRASFFGGTVTENTATGDGGAVGVGALTARLYFGGDVTVKENKKGTEDTEECNVYLDQDSDAVINADADGLGDNASIGIYVPGEASGDLFRHRAGISTSFASYTNDINLNAFHNDRVDALHAMAENSMKKILWGNALTVEVRLLATYSKSSFPPDSKGTVVYPNDTYPNNEYYPPASGNAASVIAENLYSYYSGKVSSAVFAGAFSSSGNSVTHVNWDSDEKAWMLKHPDGTTEKGSKIIIYYSNPSYLSVENNTGFPLLISSLSVLGWDAKWDAVEGFGFVTAKDGVIQSELLPAATTEGKIQIPAHGTMKFLLPGVSGQIYKLEGSFADSSSDSIDVEYTFTNGNLKPATVQPSDFSLSGKLSQSTEAVFGGRKKVCKITVTGETEEPETEEPETEEPETEEPETEEPETGEGETAGTETEQTEVLFDSLKAAVDYIKENQLTDAVIEMLTNYLIPVSDVVELPAGYNITLTTAVTGTHRYSDASGGRATISRDQGNPNPFITTADGKTGDEAGSLLIIHDLSFDGKSIAGTSNGGAVKSLNWNVRITNADFNNCIAKNGGGIFIEFSTNVSGWLEAENVNFINCVSNDTSTRKGGGAIWTNAKSFQLRGVNRFQDCSAYDQGGAVFHRIDENYSYTMESETLVIKEEAGDKTEFINCEAKAAGAFETDAQRVDINGCTFTDCDAWDRNGGALNIYALNSANPTGDCTVNVADCTFENCHAVNLGSGDRYGGAVRSTAKNTTITGCTIKNSSGKNGGAIGASNSQTGSTLRVENCTITGCTASDYGGGLYTLARDVTVVGSTIQSNTASNSGGGIYAGSDGNDRSLKLDGCTIQSNTSGGLGGGVYTNSSLTMTNDTQITDNRLSTNDRENAAGVYLKNERTLTVGNEDGSKDNTSVMNNRTKSGVSSNLRLWESGARNHASSVRVLGNLSGKIYVVNAKGKGYQFGSSAIGSPTGFSELVHTNLFKTFLADDGGLFGILDRRDAEEKTIIWCADWVCKITDGSEDVLYFDEDCTRPAIFSDVDDAANDVNGRQATDGMKTSAFRFLRTADVKLYQKTGENSSSLYDGDAYYVEMMVESYTADAEISTMTMTDSKREYFLRTADRDDTLFPYEGRAGTRSTVVRAANFGNSAMMSINKNTSLTIVNLIVDGGSRASGYKAQSNTRIITMNDATASVTLGSRAALQYSHTSQNGGAAYVRGVFTLAGGAIQDCTADGNGGGIYVSGDSGTLSVVSGSITRCSAKKGGGVYVENKQAMTMEGGRVTGNQASDTGGGIAVGGNASTLTFSKTAYVYNNTNGSGQACNVELNYDSNTVIYADGLLDSAVIGVYVPDGSSLYQKHGDYDKPFGTYTENGTDNLSSFVNDRNGLKGGLKVTDTSRLIYWLVYSLEISNLVISDNASDFGKSFTYRLTLSGTDDNGMSYTQIDFSNGYTDFSRGTAVFTLTSGQKKEFDNLPLGFTFEVRQTYPSGTPDNYYTTTIEGITEIDGIVGGRGAVGRDTDGTVLYHTTAAFTNIHAVCKITDGNDVLYHIERDSFVPAIYSKLFDAFDQINRVDYDNDKTMLYSKGLDGYNPYNQTGSQYQVEMLVKNYDMQTTAELTCDKSVTLTTAKRNASDGYSYQGASGETATVNRGSNREFRMESMFSVAAGNLTFENIAIDGKFFNANTSGGIAYVLYGAALTVGAGATLQNSSVYGNGGAVFVAGGGSMTMTAGTIAGSVVTRANSGGGAVYVADGGVMTISGGSITSSSVTGTGGSGGAVYVAGGGTMNMKSGTLTGNTVSGTNSKGAGIYLEQGGTLKLSGSPNFGGAGIDAGNLIQIPLLPADSENGGEAYSRPRQDIYLVESSGAAPESIVIDGDLTGGDGTIWVWAESGDHSRQLLPFARIDSGSRLTEANNPSVFRNARTDSDSENTTGTFLYGTTTGPETDFLYWSGMRGSRKVILKKVDDTFETPDVLKSVKFRICYTNGITVTVDGSPLENLSPLDSGVFWIGELPYGTYYLEETGVPDGYQSHGGTNRFVLTVDENGYRNGTKQDTSAPLTHMLKAEKIPL